MREEEHDPTPRSPQLVRWYECGCQRVERGECICEDDGLVTHGGVYTEGLDHGVYRGFEHARAGWRPRAGAPAGALRATGARRALVVGAGRQVGATGADQRTGQPGATHATRARRSA